MVNDFKLVSTLDNLNLPEGNFASMQFLSKVTDKVFLCLVYMQHIIM